jgi:lysophospholipase L1-like esterase
VVTSHRHGRVVLVLRVLAALFLLTIAVLGGEVWRAAHRRYLVGEHPLDLSGSYGPIGGRVVRLIMIGDSTAAGVGVDTAADSVGGQLALALAADGLRVLLSSVAVSGARAHDLAGQLNRIPEGSRDDLAVMLVGANDATHASVPSRVGNDVGAAVRRLLVANTSVVVGTCPDMGAPPAIDQPMRAILGAFGRRIASAEAGAVRNAGGVAVDLAKLTGPAFRADHADFASDGFHPSAAGYRLWAEALLPSARRAIGVSAQ